IGWGGRPLAQPWRRPPTQAGCRWARLERMSGERVGRRVVAVLAAGLVAATPAAASTGPVTLCTVRDKRAVELSGLLVTPTGYVSENDSNDDPSRILVFFL